MKTGQLSFTPELGHTEGVTWVSWCFVTGVVWSERDQRLLGLRPRWWLRALGKRRSQEIQEPCDVDRISTPSSPWPTVYPWDVIYLYPLSSTPQSRWLWDLDSGSAYWVDPSTLTCPNLRPTRVGNNLNGTLPKRLFPQSQELITLWGITMFF